MPWVLEQLFESAGRNIHDYLTIERIEPQWRTFFQDGTQIDLTSDLPSMLQQLQELAPEDIEGFFDYLSYANKMYESNLKSFYKKSLSGLHDLRTMHTLKELLQMDPMRSMDATTRKYFSNQHLRQLFNFFNYVHWFFSLSCTGRINTACSRSARIGYLLRKRRNVQNC
jgi:diapolycopene oxygenase